MKRLWVILVLALLMMFVVGTMTTSAAVPEQNSGQNEIAKQAEQKVAKMIGTMTQHRLNDETELNTDAANVAGETHQGFSEHMFSTLFTVDPGHLLTSQGFIHATDFVTTGNNSNLATTGSECAHYSELFVMNMDFDDWINQVDENNDAASNNGEMYAANSENRHDYLATNDTRLTTMDAVLMDVPAATTMTTMTTTTSLGL